MGAMMPSSQLPPSLWESSRAAAERFGLPVRAHRCPSEAHSTSFPWRYRWSLSLMRRPSYSFTRAATDGPSRSLSPGW